MPTTLEFRGADDAVRQLKTFADRAVPFAARDGLNTAAFEARRMWGDEIRRVFTTRNQFVARTALRVEKARGRRLHGMESVVGSIADFMPEQEEGGTTSGPIPGPGAARQKAGGERTRPVRIPAGIEAERAKAPTRRQRNAIAIAMAKRRGKKNVVLDRPKGGTGLFQLGGGKRRVKVKLLWAFGKGPSALKPHPTLGPTIAAIQPRLADIQHLAVLKQLKRHRLFGF